MFAGFLKFLQKGISVTTEGSQRCCSSAVYLLKVTYVLAGGVRHEDFCGHKGVINPGDLQVRAVPTSEYLHQRCH